MSMKLIVGKRAFQTLRKDLRQLFSQVDSVESASVVEDRQTGRSRGFGFVEMSSKEEGEAAIAQFHGREIVGRSLKVNEARPRQHRRRGGFDGLRRGHVYDKSDTSEQFEVIEIVAKGGKSTADHTIVFGPAQNEQVAQYFSDIAESRKRAHKTQSAINRVKKKTLAILDELF